MKEIRDIVAAYHQATKNGRQSALATVVHLEGSAYRGPGARMLVTDDGVLTGAISGGCLEGDALRKAQLVMVQNKPMLVKYDTTDEEENVLGIGLGCNGIITILIEPINADNDQNPLQLLEKYLQNRETVCLATVFSFDKKQEQPGTCLLIGPGQQQTGTCTAIDQNQLVKDAEEALGIGHSTTRYYTSEADYTAFLEVLHPPLSLLIFGAGNDCQPLVQMASILGWQTTIIDGRPNYANRSRFKDASRVLVAKPTEINDKVVVDQQTAILLMTHNYNYDIAILKQVISLPQVYTGVLGPRKKMDRMLEEMRNEGIQIDDGQLGRVFGPAGLDLGSESPEEIALSILAEIKAVMASRQGTSLRYKSTSIHQRQGTTNAIS